MNLVSIDLELGQLRFYVCTPGNEPKRVYRIDIPAYDRSMEWVKDELEAFRQDPRPFITAALGGDEVA